MFWNLKKKWLKVFFFVEGKVDMSNLKEQNKNEEDPFL